MTDYYPKITQRLNRVNVLIDQLLDENKMLEQDKMYARGILTHLEYYGAIMAEIELDKLIKSLESKL